MKAMRTLAELDIRMQKIAESNNMSLEQFKKLPRQKFIKLCNQYNNSNK